MVTIGQKRELHMHFCLCKFFIPHHCLITRCEFVAKRKGPASHLAKSVRLFCRHKSDKVAAHLCFCTPTQRLERLQGLKNKEIW